MKDYRRHNCNQPHSSCCCQLHLAICVHPRRRPIRGVPPLHPRTTRRDNCSQPWKKRSNARPFWIRGAADHVKAATTSSSSPKAWTNQEKVYIQYRDAVIISAAEVSTLNALRARQASTLFPELNNAWMGEPLGFAYVAKEKSLNLKPHSYRLCLVTGIQPANANVILDDVDSGTPARYLWLLTTDFGAPAVRPDDPGPWRGWSLAPSINPDRGDPTALRPFDVCQSARDATSTANSQS